MNFFKKKLFNYDFDGTIVHSNEIKYSAYEQVLCGNKSLLIKLNNIIRKNHDLDRYGIFKKLCDEEKKLDYNSVLQKYNKICHSNIIASKKICGVENFLEKANKNNKINVINSATPIEPLKKIIDCMDFKKDIHYIYGRPNSKVINLTLAIKKFSVKESEVLIIGDGESDRDCAENLNCDFIALDNSFSKFKRKPSYIINNFYEIIDLI